MKTDPQTTFEARTAEAPTLMAFRKAVAALDRALSLDAVREDIDRLYRVTEATREDHMHARVEM